jgi:DHA1 family inner membrane transport protein
VCSIASGYGWTSTGSVGALLGAAGLAVFAIAIVTNRQVDHGRLPPPANGVAAASARRAIQ